MKNKSKKPSSLYVKRLLLLALAISAIYTALQYFKINSYFSIGVSMMLGSLFGTFGAGIALAYVSQVLTLIAPALIIGLFLSILKQPHAFKVAFMSSLMAYLISSVFSFLIFYIPIIRFVIYFVSMSIAYILTVFILRKILKPLLIWTIVVMLMTVNLIVAPLISNVTGRPIVEKRQADQLSAALEDVEFTAYYPAYIPEGLTITDAKFEGYHNATYQHEHLSYSIGKVEVMISEKLKNQEQVFNKTDNCDISVIWFEMRSNDHIKQSSVEKSRDNLAPCRMLGKTKDGHEVYVEANKSQFEFYYAEIDGTIIVMQHDKSPKPRYSNDFENELMNVFNSMNKLDTSKIKAGY